MEMSSSDGLCYMTNVKLLLSLFHTFTDPFVCVWGGGKIFIFLCLFQFIILFEVKLGYFYRNRFLFIYLFKNLFEFINHNY